MKSLFLLVLFLLLSSLPSSLAQDGYPPCWQSDLQKILGWSDYYDSLRSSGDSLDSMDDLLAFADGQLKYSRGVWDTAPRCAEAIEFAWRTAREVNFIAASKAMEYGIDDVWRGSAEVKQELNPFRGALSAPFYPQAFNDMVDEMNALVESGEREYIAPADTPLPACSQAELASLLPLRQEFQKVVDAAAVGQSFDDLPEVAKLHIAWRETWAYVKQSIGEEGQIAFIPHDGLALLPSCAEAREFLWLMNRTIADAIMNIALAYAGASQEEDPYVATVRASVQRLKEIIAAIESSTAQPTDNADAWISCAQGQRNELLATLIDSSEFVEQETVFASLSDLLEYSQSEIAWRQSLWNSLPSCAEGIEMALSLSQAATDRAAASALSLLGVAAADNPYLSAWTESQLNTYAFWGGLSNHPVLREMPGRLRRCAAEEMDALSLKVAQFHILFERMLSFGGIERLLPLLDLMIAWHDRLLEELPACDSAIELGIMLSQGIADFASMMGLIYAEQLDDDNPYLAAFFENTNDLNRYVRSSELIADSRPALWQYGGQMAGCEVEEMRALGAIVREYQSMIEGARAMRSLEDLLEFANAQSDWRQDHWARLPACAEALELGLFIYRRAGDYIALYAFDAEQDALGRQLGGEQSLADRLTEIVSSKVLNAELRQSQPRAVPAPRCSDAETEAILATLTDYLDLLEVAATFTRWGGLQQYIDARLELRERIHTQIPPCRIGVDLSAILAGDLAGAAAMSIPGVGAALSANDILLQQLAELAASLGEGEGEAAAPRPFANNLPACSEAELATIAKNGPGYLKLLDEMAAQLQTAEGLVAYMNEPLNWQGSAYTHFRWCSEFFEIGALIHAVGSDLFTAATLEHADVASVADHFAAEPADQALLESRIDEASAAIEAGEREGPDADRAQLRARFGTNQSLPANDEDALPRCTDAELAELHAEVKDFQVISRLAIQSESISDALAYIQPHREWRRQTWSRLPACHEAYAAGIRMTEMGDILLSHMIFEYQGHSIVGSRIHRQMVTDSHHMFNWLTLLDRGRSRCYRRLSREALRCRRMIAPASLVGLAARRDGFKQSLPSAPAQPPLPRHGPSRRSREC